MRHGAMGLLCAWVLAGCATIMPASGQMWGYFSRSEAIPSLNMIAYSADRPTCEVMRARDIADAPKVAWARMTTPTPCHLVMAAPGSGYWVFGIPGHAAAHGATDLDWCRKIREGLRQTYHGRLGECVPAALRAD